MKCHASANLRALAGILGVLGARPALAADGPCAPIAVEADPSVRRRWPELPDRIRDAFDARNDIDACARIKLTTTDVSTNVEVMLPDGRSASRSVSRREDVIPTLEALLLVPERPSQPPAPAVEPPAPTTNASAKVDVSARDSQAAMDGAKPTKWPANPPGRLGVELSVAAGARMGDGQAGIGLGALSFLDVAGWLVGFEGRVDSYQGIESGTPVGAIELGVLGGRRFRFGTLALDFVAGPALVRRGLSETSRTTVAPAPAVNRVPETAPSNDTPARLLLGARLHFAAPSALRTFVGVDGEFSPAGPPAVDLPHDPHRLPVWTVGLALGATVGTPQ
jgi:hypothetical protein